LDRGARRDGDRIARIVVFGDPGLVTLFGLPPIDSPLEVICS
jgi:hypothetical protein